MYKSVIIAISLIFLAMAVLITASILVSIGTVRSYSAINEVINSPSNLANVKAAHRYLTTGTILGWIAIFVFATIFFSSLIAGNFRKIKGFKLSDYKDMTIEDIRSAVADKIDQVVQFKITVDHQKKMGVYVIIMISIVGILALILGILALFAAIDLGSVTNGTYSKEAYTYSLIATILGISSFVIAIVIIISLFNWRNRLTKAEEEAEEVVEETGIDTGSGWYESDIDFSSNRPVTGDLSPVTYNKKND